MHGVRDDEMTARWVQLGVFSPLNRLHSTDNPFNGKEPWKYNKITQSVMEEFLRLRHKLVPYLYTMNRYASRDGQPLVRLCTGWSRRGRRLTMCRMNIISEQS